MSGGSKAGTTLKRVGVTLLIVGALLGLVPDLGEAVPPILYFVPALMLVSGAFLFLRGRQDVARAIAPQVAEDAKPDVLYLRAFKSDSSEAAQVFGALLTYKLLSGWQPKRNISPRRFPTDRLTEATFSSASHRRRVLADIRARLALTSAKPTKRNSALPTRSSAK